MSFSIPEPALHDLPAPSPHLPAWLRPWLADELAGATVSDVLPLLLNFARDPNRFVPAEPAAYGVVHPGKLVRRNQGRLCTRAADQDWILEHQDGRAMLRLRETTDGCIITGYLAD